MHAGMQRRSQPSMTRSSHGSMTHPSIARHSQQGSVQRTSAPGDQRMSLPHAEGSGDGTARDEGTGTHGDAMRIIDNALPPQHSFEGASAHEAGPQQLPTVPEVSAPAEHGQAAEAPEKTAAAAEEFTLEGSDLEST